MRETANLGDQRRVTVTFADETGVLLNPTTVTARVIRPDGTEATITGASLTNPSAGVFQALLPRFDQTGIWRWRIAGTGNLNEATEGRIFVPRSAFTLEP